MALSRRRALALVWIAPALLFVALVQLIEARYRIEVPPRLGPEARAAAIAPLRDVLERRPARAPSHPELDRSLPGRGPVVVQVWLDGTLRSRIATEGDTAAEALASAATELAADRRLNALDDDERRHARVKVALVHGRGPLLDEDGLLAGIVEGLTGVDLAMLGLHPGLEGLGARWERGQVVLLPHDMIRAQLLDGEQAGALVPELRLGLDRAGIEDALAQLARMDRTSWDHTDARRFRIRADEFVELPEPRRSEPPVPLTRGLPPRPELSAANLRAAALAGGHYLTTHIDADGRYDYELNLTTGEKSADYNLPRHSGASYFLAELYRLSGDTTLLDPLRRAFRHMDKLIVESGCSGTLPDGKKFGCLADRGQSSLGSTALAVVALAEYERATRETTFHELMVQMAEFVLWMQRDDGSYRHFYDVAARQPDHDRRTLYFDGEAALAMARMHVVTGEERYRDSAARALDYLVGWYDGFVGGFIYGEEHWTCIAAEALYPAVKRVAWLDFCEGYSRFLRAQQPGAGDLPSQEDWAGAYGVVPFVAPHNTPAGSRSEAMVSTYLLGLHHGRPNPAVRGQVLAAMHYLLGQQIREEGDFDVAASARGLGAIPKSPLERVVRIDYPQHVCSAMMRTAMFLEQEAR